MALTQVSSGLISSVANTAITGNIISSQITSVANTQVTGLMTASQIATVANTQITGLITSIQLANTGVTATTYGNTTSIPSITVGTDGRITAISNTSVTAGVSQGKTTAISMTFGF